LVLLLLFITLMLLLVMMMVVVAKPMLAGGRAQAPPKWPPRPSLPGSQRQGAGAWRGGNGCSVFGVEVEQQPRNKTPKMAGEPHGYWGSGEIESRRPDQFYAALWCVWVFGSGYLTLAALSSTPGAPIAAHLQNPT
jgi:hypothetical protein